MFENLANKLADAGIQLMEREGIPIHESIEEMDRLDSVMVTTDVKYQDFFDPRYVDFFAQFHGQRFPARSSFTHLLGSAYLSAPWFQEKLVIAKDGVYVEYQPDGDYVRRRGIGAKVLDLTE